MKRIFCYTVLTISFLIGGFIIGCSAKTPTSADSGALEQRVAALESEIKTLNATISQLQDEIETIRSEPLKSEGGTEITCNDISAQKDIKALAQLICVSMGSPKDFYDYISTRYGGFSEETGRGYRVILLEFGDGTIIRYRYPQ